MEVFFLFQWSEENQGLTHQHALGLHLLCEDFWVALVLQAGSSQLKKFLKSWRVTSQFCNHLDHHLTPAGSTRV
ncbi:MAG: hypothetical protein CMM01_00085 [Rhodopirellula sp.]|nr:hypothetical protein [Rhodopirellula sp.]